MTSQLLLSIFIDGLLAIVLLMSIRMINGSLGLEYFYVRGSSFWEIERIKETHRADLSKTIGWLNLFFVLSSMVIGPLIVYGVASRSSLIILWIILLIAYLVSFFITFEKFAKKSLDSL